MQRSRQPSWSSWRLADECESGRRSWRASSSVSLFCTRIGTFEYPSTLDELHLRTLTRMLGDGNDHLRGVHSLLTHCLCCRIIPVGKWSQELTQVDKDKNGNVTRRP